MTKEPIRIGTRGSRLALVQAETVRGMLEAHHADFRDSDAIEMIVIKTTGDRVTDRPLAEVGGKGLFAKELDAALIANEIDIAVHSLKDVETELPEGLCIGCVLSRADARDALVARDAARLNDLPVGASVGTASLRRAAQALAARPDLKVSLLRGNVPTRLEKIREGLFDATFLACAGLDRLGFDLAAVGATPMPPDIMVPAVGQGAVCVVHRADDHRAVAALGPLQDPAAAATVRAERAMLRCLDGSCRTPIAGLASLDGSTLVLDGLIAAPDGSALYRAQRTGPADDPDGLGAAVAEALIADAGSGFLDRIR